MIATDGDVTVTIFNYAEDRVHWTNRTGYSIFMGYSAGDNVTSYEIPGSQTENVGIVDIIPGNTGVIGSWIFRLDQEQLVFADCTG